MQNPTVDLKEPGRPAGETMAITEAQRDEIAMAAGKLRSVGVFMSEVKPTEFWIDLQDDIYRSFGDIIATAGRKIAKIADDIEDTRIAHKVKGGAE
jgi:hypothetical protein